eukprot:CCRYP_008093-RF/>CCRYP_008093-RF protein AED:0.39 eAED:0.42 QI:0/0/0/1/0/0/2/0/554
MSSNPSKPQGGILRSRPPKEDQKPTNGDRTSGRVTFSSHFETATFHPDNNHPDAQDDDDDDDDEVDVPPKNLGRTANDDEYDSDDDDAILASGEAFSMGRLEALGDDSDTMDDAAVHSTTKIEYAKRKRGKARQYQEKAADDYDMLDSHSDEEVVDQSLSLITDQNADPDYYESNAGGNASCPVEPFNMDAEKESGLGYFDGDTYIFRKKVVEGEEDAWLDGAVGGDDEEEGGAAGPGGLDSTSIWKPREDGEGKKPTKTSKYVSEDDTQEDIGRRLVTLLQNAEETVMTALTRHGSALRQLQAQEQKLAKKNKVKKRKQKPTTDDEAVVDSSTTQSSAEKDDENIDLLKSKIKQTREAVEELTELADALLFEGETDAYELTKSDWIHRFKLDDGNIAKRPPEVMDGALPSKKARRNYFSDTTTTSSNDDAMQKEEKSTSQHTEIMWEYKGNEDGAIHGPFTSRQMLEWTSCGYFVGASAVDIRQVGSGKTGDIGEKTDVDDLMADLMEDEEVSEDKAGSNEWMRSDAVDFNLYLRSPLSLNGILLSTLIPRNK